MIFTHKGVWLLVRLNLTYVTCSALVADSWYLESATSGLLANLVSSLHRDDENLGHPRRKTSLSPVALCFAELEPV